MAKTAESLRMISERAKQIRMPKEKWNDAIKRATAELKAEKKI